MDQNDGVFYGVAFDAAVWLAGRAVRLGRRQLNGT